MELIDSFRQEGTPPEPTVYTFVFDHYDPHTRLYEMLRLRDDNQWMFSPFLMGEYHLGGDNSHLGERVAFQHVGQVMLNRLFMRIAY
jgi:hypothetical protein